MQFHDMLRSAVVDLCRSSVAQFRDMSGSIVVQFCGMAMTMPISLVL
jgi:hypothetical protein